MKSIFKAMKRVWGYLAVAFILIGALLFFTLGAENKWPSIVAFSIAVVFIIFNALGLFFYTRGSKNLQTLDTECRKKAIKYFSLAITFGLSSKMEVVAATLILQEGDREKGKTLLEGLLSDRAKDVAGAAETSLSMYYWMKGDLEKAIELCQDAMAKGYKDKNSYINLSTYYLEKGDTKNFSKIIKEAKSYKMYIKAMLDLESAYAQMNGDWYRSGVLLTELFNNSDPAFIDPYIHFSMVYLHYGEVKEALNKLHMIKEKCHITNTSMLSEDQIDTLIKLVEDENSRWGLLEEINKEPGIFYKRIIPEVKKGLSKPDTPSLPSFIQEETPITLETEDEEKDEDDINTDITEEDEKWLRSHV